MATKKPYTVGYYSAYYRGLECLLNLWPQIREKCFKETGHYPKLSAYYGWESWVAIQGEDDFYERMEAKFEEMKDQGVTVHGRVSHEDLAKAMMETQVWAYPTSFEEIFAITAVKANAAHMKPVITNVAALKETGGPVATRISTRRIGFDEYSQRKFIDAVVHALKNSLTDDEIKAQDEWVKQWKWSEIAKQWAEAL